MSSFAILTYNGPGSSKLFSQALKDQLVKHCDDRFYQVKEVQSLIDCWNDPKSVRALFVPGSLMREVSKQNGIPQVCEELQLIFDKYCINYYGSGGGAMLACSSFQRCFIQDPNHPIGMTITLDIAEKLGLDLVPVRTIGPMDPILDGNHNGPRPIEEFRISPCIVNNEEIPCAHVWSPAFPDVATLKGAEVLSTRPKPLYDRITVHDKTYKEAVRTMSPESISTESFCYQKETAPESYRFRKVICTSFQLEMGSKAVQSDDFKELFNVNTHDQLTLADKLKYSDSRREQWMRRNFIQLGIGCKPLEATQY